MISREEKWKKLAYVPRTYVIIVLLTILGVEKLYYQSGKLLSKSKTDFSINTGVLSIVNLFIIIA